MYSLDMSRNYRTTQGPANNTDHQLVHLNKRKLNKREVNLVKSTQLSLVVRLMESR
jgi:hypothetical protein